MASVNRKFCFLQKLSSVPVLIQSLEHLKQSINFSSEFATSIISRLQITTSRMLVLRIIPCSPLELSTLWRVILNAACSQLCRSLLGLKHNTKLNLTRMMRHISESWWQYMKKRWKNSKVEFLKNFQSIWMHSCGWKVSQKLELTF